MFPLPELSEDEEVAMKPPRRQRQRYTGLNLRPQPVQSVVVPMIRRASPKAARPKIRHKCREAHCRKTYCSRESLKDHLKYDHRGQNKPFRCPESGCGLGFLHQAWLVRHARTHSGERPYACQYCDKFFALASTRHSHEQNIHSLHPKSYKCTMCPAGRGIFKQSTSLINHRRIEHGLYVSPTFQCETCQKVLTSKRSLKDHIRAIHTKERAFRCSEGSCIYSATSASNLR